MDETFDDQHQPSGISRRSAIKRIGAGAAIAWSAPVLMSINAKAFAASTVCRPDQAQSCFCGSDAELCGSGGGVDCFCATSVGGTFACYNNTACGTNPCTTDADCNGGACVTVCCTGCTSNQCLPFCGSGRAPAPAGPGGKMASQS